jgi:hypothetical protein
MPTLVFRINGNPKMYSVVYRLALLSLLPLVTALHAQTGTFCAVTVEVTGPDNLPIQSTWMELLGPDGKVEARNQMDGPIYRLCDFGFGQHSLRVGANECFPVTISNLRVRFGDPIFLKVHLNACSGGEEITNACRIYFRIVDDGGKALPGTRTALQGLASSLTADKYGRVQTFLPKDHTMTYSFLKPGFEAGSAQLACTERREVDRVIVLTPVK